MKKHLHKAARFTAIVLLSSLPLPFNATADDFTKKPIDSISDDTKELNTKTKRHTSP